MSIRNKAFQRLLAIAVVGVMASSAYAFTAGNSVPATKAGDGAGAVSGYTVSSVAYELESGNPQNIDLIAFSLGGASTGTVKARADNSGVWYDCVWSAGNSRWECDSDVGTQLTVADADNLTVVAVA